MIGIAILYTLQGNCQDFMWGQNQEKNKRVIVSEVTETNSSQEIQAAKGAVTDHTR